MASHDAHTTTARDEVRTSPLAELRKAAGYRSAREFAQAIGVPATTYSRWERSSGGPDTGLPMRAAWSMADALGCTIDQIVGRADGDAARRDLNAEYRALSESGRERLDEYIRFLGFRDRVVASEGR